MAPPTKKELNKGFYGFADDSAEFLKTDNPDSARGNWDAEASGHGYNARFNDDSGHVRGANWDDSNDHGLVNRLPEERQDYAHEGLSRILDNQEDLPSGKWLPGGGPVSDNVGNDGPGWQGSNRKGPRIAPKTGPRTNAKG